MTDDLNPQPLEHEPHVGDDAGLWAQLAPTLDDAVQEAADGDEPLEIDTAIDGLVYRPRYVTFKTAAKSGKHLAKIKDPAQQQLLGAIDTLILACDEMCVYTADGVKPLPSETGQPVRFDEQLCAGLRAVGHSEFTERLSAREIVRRVFGDNDWAILQAGQEVSAWMADLRTKVTERTAKG